MQFSARIKKSKIVVIRITFFGGSVCYSEAYVYRYVIDNFEWIFVELQNCCSHNNLQPDASLIYSLNRLKNFLEILCNANSNSLSYLLLYLVWATPARIQTQIKRTKFETKIELF